jgi:hypothetical protein
VIGKRLDHSIQRKDNQPCFGVPSKDNNKVNDREENIIFQYSDRVSITEFNLA